MNFDAMLRKPLEAVELIGDKDRILFKFQDGTSRSFGVEGDCCSLSWIEHLTLPNDVSGAVILEVLDGNAIPWDGHECTPDAARPARNTCGHDYLNVYNTHFVTDRGNIVLEYCNDSNGYYGGYLVE